MTKKNKGLTVVEMLITLSIILIVGWLVLGAITGGIFGPSTASAQNAITAQGFHDVGDVTRHYWGSHYRYGCSQDDTFAFTASAINANSQRVNVVACTGRFFKGYTIITSR